MKTLRLWAVLLTALAFATSAWADEKECQKQCALKCSQSNASCSAKCPKPKHKNQALDPDGNGSYKPDPAANCLSACGQKIGECVQPCIEKCKG